MVKPEDNVEAATELIKRVYKSWRFSEQKITVAEATALALLEVGLLSDKQVEFNLEDITVDRLVKKYRPRRR